MGVLGKLGMGVKLGESTIKHNKLLANEQIGRTLRNQKYTS